MQTIKNKNPYEVKEMETKDIYDWQAVSKQFGTNYQISTLNTRVGWNEVKHFRVKKESRSSVFHTYSYKENEEIMRFKVDKKCLRRSKATEVIQLISLYAAPPSISKLKKDLLSLCKIKVIANAVSYTHLDVYKRQGYRCGLL